jgi:hypothetical protein
MRTRMRSETAARRAAGEAALASGSVVSLCGWGDNEDMLVPACPCRLCQGAVQDTRLELQEEVAYAA